jgi:hypothetical protein
MKFNLKERKMNMLDTYTSFKLLYYALDAIYDETKNKGLGEFCSNMNPFIFTDEGSADPAIYSDYKIKFEEKFNKECSIIDAYNFSKDFLNKETDIYAKYAADAFNEISFDDWSNAANNLI